MILLASSDNKLIACWERGLINFTSISFSSNFVLTKDRLTKNKIETLVLDYDLPGLNGANGVSELFNDNFDLKIVVYCSGLSDEAEWELFKIGVKGCCSKDDTPEQVSVAIKSIQQDELWIKRKFANFMLKELVEVTKEKNKIEQAIKDLLENLTKREYEIAMLVGRGESNKLIASKLAITERTVKAHLTEIFRKLHISDRIKLALMMKDAISLSKYRQLPLSY